MGIKNNEAPKHQNLFANMGNVLSVTWETDKLLFILLFFIGLSYASLPILISYMAKLLIDKLVIAQNTTQIVTFSIISLLAFRYLISFINKYLSVFNNQYLSRIIRYKIENHLTYKFNEKTASLDIAHFDNPETYNLLQKATRNYPGRIISFYENLIYSVFSIFGFIGAVLALLPFGSWIPAIIIATAFPAFYIKNKFGRKEWSVFNSNTLISKELGYVSDILEDVKSLKELKIFRAGPLLLKKLKNLQEEVYGTLIKPIKGYGKWIILPTFINAVVFFILIYIKLPATAAGLITIGSFTFYISMLDNALMQADNMLSQMSNLLEENRYVGYYFDALKIPKLIKEAVPGHSFDNIEPPKIEFQGVSFKYDNGPLILKNISFQLEPGKHLAIVGSNGAGKTTLIKLLLRFYDPLKGDIQINDYNLKDLKIDNWYRFVSILFQDFNQYAFTVKENIMIGNPGLISDKKMREAAEKASASEFIDELPKKFNQRLGKRFEEGIDLSQGQWQKLALARAFYEEAPILILDEPTSAIDSDAEAEIFNNLYNVYKNKTLILVSHRFSTVRNADKIIVLKKGQIIEEGNHEELMDENGVYARMFRKQAEGYEE